VKKPSAKRAGPAPVDTHLAAISPERAAQGSRLLAAVDSAQEEFDTHASNAPIRVVRRARADQKVRHRVATETTLKLSPEPTEALPKRVMAAVALDGQSEEPLASDAVSPPVARRILRSVFEGPGQAILCPLLDFALACLAVVLALGGFNAALRVSPDRFAGFALPGLVVLMLFMLGGYRGRLRLLVLDWLRLLVPGVTLATVALAVLDLLNNGEITDRSTWLRMWLITTVGLTCGRITLALFHRWARSRRLLAEPVLIVGAGLVGTRVARRLEAHPQYGLLPIGFIDDDEQSLFGSSGKSAPVLGTVDEIEQVLSATRARTVIVAFASATDSRISGLVRRCQRLGVQVSVVPRMFDAINDRVTYERLGGLPVLGFSSVDPHGWQFAIKHALDRSFAAVMLLILSPLLAAVALAVRLTSSGPTLFRQQRVGRDGKVFDLYKFRSMEWRGPTQTTPHDEYRIARLVASDTGPGGVERDQRLTRIGRVLRSLSLDELPQLFNVLKGDMSIVGPRPERPEFVEMFGRDIPRYHDRHRVRSGITGWAQVHGLRGPTSLVDRIEWDNYYIAHWSLGLDLKILILTAIAVFRGE